MDKQTLELLIKAIAYGYQNGCSATEGGYQGSPEEEAKELLPDFLSESEEPRLNNEGLGIKSDLPASGFTFTNTDLHEAARVIVTKAKQQFGDKQIIAGVWAYREQGYEILSCDLYVNLSDEKRSYMPVTITTCGHASYLIWDEPEVMDMTEALHLSGLITSALKAKIELGRHRNETNEATLKVPLKPQHTNGKIDLFN